MLESAESNLFMKGRPQQIPTFITQENQPVFKLLKNLADLTTDLTSFPERMQVR
jgi:hypothetical protein